MKKYLAESLFEYIGFTEEGDPVKDMGIGTDQLIVEWMEKNKVPRYRYKITKKHYIVGNDTIDLTNNDIGEFPDYIKFVFVHGGFHCLHNGLKSLKGFPEKIGGSFFVSHNNLVNLIGGPKIVDGSYAASNNQLRSLEGIPEDVNEAIYLNDNDLNSLQYIQIQTGDLYIQNNPIHTLKYFPEEIYGDLHITRSKILKKEAIQEICNVSGEIYEY